MTSGVPIQEPPESLVSDSTFPDRVQTTTTLPDVSTCKLGAMAPEEERGVSRRYEKFYDISSGTEHSRNICCDIHTYIRIPQVWRPL